MVPIPAGSFSMGCQKSEDGCWLWESPAHRVRVPALELGKYEVTFAEWDACVADGGCKHEPADEGFGRGDRPAIDVSWDDAQEYVRWLSRKTGKDYRLPTEAEWEYAARAGTTTAFSTGDCVHTRQANYNGQGASYVLGQKNCNPKTGVYLKKTQPAGSYAANPFGLHDMHGNVYEWTQDCWNERYLGAPTGGEAWTAGDCSRRVVRGGSWKEDAEALRAVQRIGNNSGRRFDSHGFRVARTLTP